MKSKGPGFVVKQDEDGAFIATFPSMPGCISQGKTKKQAIANIKEAIELHERVKAFEKMASWGRKHARQKGLDVSIQHILKVQHKRRASMVRKCEICSQPLGDHCEGCCIDFEAGVHKGKFCGKKGNGIGKVIRR